MASTSPQPIAGGEAGIQGNNDDLLTPIADTSAYRNTRCQAPYNVPMFDISNAIEQPPLEDGQTQFGGHVVGHERMDGGGAHIGPSSPRPQDASAARERIGPCLITIGRPPLRSTVSLATLPATFKARPSPACLGEIVGGGGRPNCRRGMAAFTRSRSCQETVRDGGQQPFVRRRFLALDGGNAPRTRGTGTPVVAVEDQHSS